MLRSKQGMAAVVAVTLGFFSSLAQAALVSVKVTGIVDFVDLSQNILPQFAGAAAGQSMEIDYTIETTTVDSSSSPGRGSYVDPIKSMTLIVNGTSYVIQLQGGISPSNLEVYDDVAAPGFPGQVVDALSYSAGDVVGPNQRATGGTIDLRRRGTAPINILSSDALVAAPTLWQSFLPNDLASTQGAFMFISATDINVVLPDNTSPSSDIAGHITGVSVVPAPATLPLLMSGLLAVGARFRPQRRKA